MQVSDTMHAYNNTFIIATVCMQPYITVWWTGMVGNFRGVLIFDFLWLTWQS